MAKDVKRGDKQCVLEDGILAKIEAHLDTGKPVITLQLTPEEKAVSRLFWLMTDKPTIFACNVKESDLANADQNPYVLKVREYVKTHLACEAVIISAQIESDLIDLSDDELRTVRGAHIAMVFQDPMTSLNPVYRVGDQIAEMIRAHREVSKREALTRAVELLHSVGIPNPERRARDYPHEFSGGMRQRVMIAMALALEPELLIADEPTTALDVTIQAQILNLLRTLNREKNTSVVLITHDLGVVAELADKVVVMYAGQVVEQASLDELFYQPQHPYTWGLLGSIPRPDEIRPDRLPQIPGQPPSLRNPPTGCRFAARCEYVFADCVQPPPLRSGSGIGHLDRCWLSADAKAGRR
jgi:oligopeptide/dipeptide ABC transporter ATP-binding protein